MKLVTALLKVVAASGDASATLETLLEEGFFDMKQAQQVEYVCNLVGAAVLHANSNQRLEKFLEPKVEEVEEVDYDHFELLTEEEWEALAKLESGESEFDLNEFDDLETALSSFDDVEVVDVTEMAQDKKVYESPAIKVIQPEAQKRPEEVFEEVKNLKFRDFYNPELFTRFRRPPVFVQEPLHKRVTHERDYNFRKVFVQ